MSTACGSSAASSQWMLVNHWMIDAVTTKQAPLALQCLLIDANPTTQSVVSSAQLQTPGLHTRSFSQQELHLTQNTIEFQLHFTSTVTRSMHGAEPTLTIATPNWTHTFSFGEMDVTLVPKRVNWLLPLRSFAGESGAFTTSHVFAMVVANPLPHAVTFDGFTVGGGVELERTAYVVNPSNVFLTIPKQAKDLSAPIAIAPGQTVALYCAFRQPSAYRNVYFQPALRLTYQGQSGYELTNPALYTETKFKGDPTAIYPTVNG
ncbi:hypothetical protein TC41_0030 [Alicyclobacillus acidocaldarius subsp. acidocaldarius Tc-4-1]|uniref:Uncharacterized protein n=1 Tax=Alicyclobacillus acidocaldarius (strain Tc-4-1) TaxID=1048834 RepID=F8IHP3_ALIAT|nr:hypothetical protein TC41_0030 [Alicyclobacillus acidocaldarius subsp. acidocaldarius Tc-4-1]